VRFGLTAHHDYALLNAVGRYTGYEGNRSDRFGETLGSIWFEAPNGGASGSLTLYRYGTHQGDACLGLGGLTVGATCYNEGTSLPTGQGCCGKIPHLHSSTVDEF
jgi:hypothetical protein